MKRPLATICLFIILILAISTKIIKPEYPDYSSYDDKYIQFSGTVDKITYKNKNNSLQMLIYLKNVTSPSDVDGVLCYMSDASYCPHIGSVVTIGGSAFLFESPTNPGQFDSLTYYSILNLGLGAFNCNIVTESKDYSHFLDTLFRIRRNISSMLDNALPETESSVMKTMLLGESTEIDQNTKALYQRNGIAHILSISGLHISLIGIGLYKFLRKFLMPRSSAITSAIFMFLYGLMTGFSVSSLRAIVMFAFSMTAVIIGKTYDLPTALSLCCALILLDNPMYIYHSGFAFSFGCVAGIAFILPLLMPDKDMKLPSFLTPIFEGLCMTVIGLPLYFWYYNQLPIYALFLNLFVIPIMTILVTTGILLILCLYLFPSAGGPFKALIVGILQFFEKSAEFADSLPGHFYTPGRPYLWQIIVYLTVLFILIRYKNKVRFALRWLIVLTLSLFLTLRFNPELSVTMLDIGQGDSCVISVSDCPISVPGLTQQYNLIIDSGSSSVKEIGKYRLIPYLKYKGLAHIDAILVTHTDSDHLNGILELLVSSHDNGITISRLYLPDANKNIQNDNYFKLMTLASDANIPVSFIKRGDILYESKTTRIQCLSPFEGNIASDINELSAVVLLNHDLFSALFTGDIQNDSENELVDYISRTGLGTNLTFLKCAHHGSSSSTSLKFLNIVNPIFTGISCGLDNSYGHPHKETLNRLQKLNSTVYRTDINGAIELRVQNNKLDIKLYKTDG